MVHKARITALTFVIGLSCLLSFFSIPIASAHSVTRTSSTHMHTLAAVPNSPPCYERTCNGKPPYSGCINTKSFQAAANIVGPNGNLGAVYLYYTRYCDIWFGEVISGGAKEQLSTLIFNDGGTSFATTGFGITLYSDMLDDSVSRTQVCIDGEIQFDGTTYVGVACS